MNEKVMVVDDEISIVTLLEFNLTKAGYEVIPVTDGLTALHLVKEKQPDLIVLDLMLPGMDGIDVCKQLREQKLLTPIIMLTAKDDEFDKVLGLELGADDYITKPFSPREVVSRVKAVLRRTILANDELELSKEEQIVIGELEIYPKKYEAYFKGQEMECTPKEFELLVYLAQNKGNVLSREQILNAVWNFDYVGDTRIADVHVSHLREKIEENTKKPGYIKTVRGFGYKLEEPK
ncbi:response regulator transcription factor [Lentibacillus sp. L22]|uniref:response regulator transcription factor n=1 Tax=Lentibacillus TaxID=175304 RepID=UPI0022B177D5|nr:response regulator transcription factor [Lentibacillus daqui]